METIKKGSRGESVKTLQRKLNLFPDGIFGSLTEEALKNWQKQHSLKPDGICGPVTWATFQSEERLGIQIATRKINDIILHCSATPEGRDVSVDTIRQWHKNQGWSDIGYHYVVYRDGTVHSGRNINVVGSHCTNHNTGSIGVCYIGGCDKTGKLAKDTRTPEQRTALIQLVRKLLQAYGLSLANVHCHNSYTSKKACPSFKLSDFKKEFNEMV